MSELKIVFVIVAFAALVACQETYSDRYDDEVDADCVLSDETARTEYLNCFLGKGACSPAAEFYAGIFPEVFLTQCKKCTEKQMVLFDKVAKWYTINQPDQWNIIVAKIIELEKEKNVQGAE